MSQMRTIKPRHKLCSACDFSLPITSFYVANKKKNYISAVCKGCHKRRAKDWQAANTERKKAIANSYNANLKLVVLSHYSAGTPTCKCCNEREIKFLAIDHINGGGFEHRKTINVRGGSQFYQWLKNNNYPQGFQVLCHNCNMAKGLYGKCPHEKNT